MEEDENRSLMRLKITTLWYTVYGKIFVPVLFSHICPNMPNMGICKINFYRFIPSHISHFKTAISYATVQTGDWSEAWSSYFSCIQKIIYLKYSMNNEGMLNNFGSV